MRSNNIDKNGDFIFRWKIENKQIDKKNSLVNCIRNIAREMLNLIVFSYAGKDLKIDGFRFLSDKKIHKIFK